MILEVLLLLTVTVCVMLIIQSEFLSEEIYSLRIRLVCPPHPSIRKGMEEEPKGLRSWCSVLLDM